MNTRDIIYYVEHRAEQFRRERAHAKLVQLAKLNAAHSSTRVFRLFPSRNRPTDATSD